MKRLDGWHIICGQEVYIENDRIIRGRRNSGTTYPYHYDKKYKSWIRQNSIRPENLHSELYKMF